MGAFPSQVELDCGGHRGGMHDSLRRRDSGEPQKQSAGNWRQGQASVEGGARRNAGNDEGGGTRSTDFQGAWRALSVCLIEVDSGGGRETADGRVGARGSPRSLYNSLHTHAHKVKWKRTVAQCRRHNARSSASTCMLQLHARYLRAASRIFISRPFLISSTSAPLCSSAPSLPSRLCPLSRQPAICSSTFRTLIA